MLLALKNRLYTGLAEKWKVFGAVSVGSVVCLIFVQQSFSASLVFTRWHQQATYTDVNGISQVYRLFFLPRLISDSG